jgi:DNA-binding transcriptional MerR regulator
LQIKALRERVDLQEEGKVLLTQRTIKEEDQNSELREEIKQLKEEVFNKTNKMYL